MPETRLATAMDHPNYNDTVASDYVGSVIGKNGTIDSSIASRTFPPQIRRTRYCPKNLGHFVAKRHPVTPPPMFVTFNDIPDALTKRILHIDKRV